MRVLKELTIAGPVLFLLFLLSDTFLGSAATPTTNSQAWIGAELIPAERLLFDESIVTGTSWQGTYSDNAPSNFAKTPAVRIRDVFAQFVPGERSRQG
jgi:hypothetical protein